MAILHEPLPVQMVGAARECLGTPFVHQGRRPGVGLDCIGLLVVAAQAVGLPVHDVRGYSPTPSPERVLERRLAMSLDLVPNEPREPGDVLAFAVGNRERLPCHIGMLDTDPEWFLHAYAPSRAVIRSRLDRRWLRRLHSVWRWPHG